MRDRYGLPSAIAGMNHLGKQLAAKRRAEAKLSPETEKPAAQKRQKKAQVLEKKVQKKRLTAQAWFKANRWKPFVFQTETWAHIAAGKSGLVHASTGSGKTYAVWLGILDAFACAPATSGLKVLWLTPMRALATDTTKALARAAEEMGTPWRVEARTGDTDAAAKTQQSKALPEALVTTPESLCLLLARADAKEILRGVQAIVVDEWHELLGNKRGVQTQLALAHIRTIAPTVLVWGISATLGNLDEAATVLMNNAPATENGFTSVSGLEPKTLTIDTLLPPSIERFPWAGHIGLKMLPEVIGEIESSASTLIFTNVRSAAEIWYQAILNARPDWAGLIAVHHGSLSKEVRTFVEDAIKSGALKAVVCTSSLDLGVDFLPVERVLQIGSPKGIARLLQRAGRSGHAPGRPSRITIVPTQAIELVEAAAAREAAQAKRIEARTPPHAPLDVLVQHMVTLGLGAGFAPQELFDEVRTTHAYRDLTRAAFDWCLQFASDGGALTAYPDYHKLVRDDLGNYRVVNPMIARRHRMSIGTIVSDGAIDVKWQSGGRLGSIEESFIARLKVGDVFSFAGHVLELVRVRDMVASVKKSKRKTGIVPQWGGGRMPLSTELADATLALLGEMAQGKDASPEAVAIRPLINVQIAKSALPTPQRLVMETIVSDEGAHFYCYPFAGRLAHIGLAALIGWRASEHDPATFSFSANDYGFELHSAAPFDWKKLIANGLFDPNNAEDDIVSALNASELAKRRFREIARVAGLIFQGFPGAPRSTKQLQVSSALLFEVFQNHDPDNQLLAQARNESLRQELDLDRIRSALKRMHTLPRIITQPARFTPFSFPLMAERLRDTVSTESLSQRLQKLAAELEKEAA
jgi:ATP-dependent helicase Lhr and Lhr-like helicase